MARTGKDRARRVSIRKNRPDGSSFRELVKTPEVRLSLSIAIAFWVAAAAILTLRERTVRYRPDQYVHNDVLSRVEFYASNREQHLEQQQEARDAAPRVFTAVPKVFGKLEATLSLLPEEVAKRSADQIPEQWGLDAGTITALRNIHLENAADYKQWVSQYIDMLREAQNTGQLVILPEEEREKDLRTDARRYIKLQGTDNQVTVVHRTQPFGFRDGQSFSKPQHDELLNRIGRIADRCFPPSVSANIAALTVTSLRPTHELDRDLTAMAQNEAAARVPVSQRHVPEKAVLVPRGSVVTPATWKLLCDEQQAFVDQSGSAARLQRHAGVAGLALLITLALTGYTVRYQPRIAQNHMRGTAIASLLLAMLLLAQLAGLGTFPLLVFGVAPTLLVAMILSIAYDQRFAMGFATLHGALVTIGLDQGVGFFLIIFMGIIACCFTLDEVRTRSKLIEVGGAMALAMIIATVALGSSSGDPLMVIGTNSLCAGAAGLGVGFVVLGILPFIEKTFRISTSMTLLETADASHPLLRRLSTEAPGTFNHSLHVATLAEAAAEAIGANSLLCRVGSYYHDVGKLRKPDYFCENQLDGHNRHLNLTPNVSQLIIVGHVKDGVELARDYNLPPALLPIIQQHHGTTLVEYFYHQALCRRNNIDPQGPQISEAQYRYPGPKPRSREAAIVMIADAVESATRASKGASAGRIESLVHDLVMKRLLDGQFDESGLTLSELSRVQLAMLKSLAGIHHSRLEYPSREQVEKSSEATVKTA